MGLLLKTSLAVFFFRNDQGRVAGSFSIQVSVARCNGRCYGLDLPSVCCRHPQGKRPSDNIVRYLQSGRPFIHTPVLRSYKR